MNGEAQMREERLRIAAMAEEQADLEGGRVGKVYARTFIDFHRADALRQFAQRLRKEGVSG